MTQAVDYSTSRPNPADLAAAGYIGVLRYLAPLPNLKVVTGDELASLHANGLAVGFVWETTAGRALQGYSAGRADAIAANNMLDDLGATASVTVYFAVDQDVNPADADDYFRGANDASKRPVGGYGEYDVIEHLLDANLISKAWQTAAWSHGKHSARAHIFQRADAAANPPPGTDVNDILQDDWGQWAPNGVDDMPSIDEVKNAVREVLNEGTGDGVTNADGSAGAWPATSKRTYAEVHAIFTAISNPEALAAAVVAKLPAGSVDAKIVEDAVKEALREGTG